jgi:hypothetical protein
MKLLLDGLVVEESKKPRIVSVAVRFIILRSHKSFAVERSITVSSLFGTFLTFRRVRVVANADRVIGV